MSVKRLMGRTCFITFLVAGACVQPGGDSASSGGAVARAEERASSERMLPLGPCRTWGVLETPRVSLTETWIQRPTGSGWAIFGGTTGPYPDGAAIDYGEDFYWEYGYSYGGNGWTWRCEADGIYLVEEYSSRGVTFGLDTYTYTPVAPILIFPWSAAVGDSWQVRSAVRMEWESLDELGYYSYRHDMEGMALNFLVEEQHGIVVNGRPTHALVLLVEGVGTWMPFYGSHRLWIVEGLGLVRIEDPDLNEFLEIAPWR